jgi:hypothetical protein
MPWALPNGRQQGIVHEFGPHMPGHCPTNYPPGWPVAAPALFEQALDRADQSGTVFSVAGLPPP